MVTRLYLIRHGETEDADSRRYKGHLDVPLSERGIRQIERLSQYIVQDSSRWFNNSLRLLKMVQSSSNSSTLNNVEPLNNIELSSLIAVYCSDLKRAIQSAEIIARPFGLKPIILSDLRERNFGEWEGMTFEEIEKKWPDVFKAWAENPLKHSPPGGESTVQVRERVVNALNKILDEVQDSSMMAQNSSKLNNIEQCSFAIVAHGGVNRIILCELLGMPLENIFRIEQDYACLNIIEFHNGYPVVILINGK